MKSELTKKEWQRVQSLLQQRCYTSYEPTRVDVVLVERKKGDYSIDVFPVSDANSHALHCVEDIVDVVRAFNLSFWVGYDPAVKKVVGHVF